MNAHRLHELRELWREAEKQIKIVEDRGDGKLSIPSVNQLRYVSYHVLNHVLDGSEADLLEAAHHCGRALYDCFEMEALFYMKSFAAFQHDFPKEPISDTVPEYFKWIAAHEAAQVFIRTHTQSDGRYQYYEQFAPYIEQLSVINKHLPRAREAINKKRQKDSWTMRIAVLGLIASMLSLAYSVAPSYWNDLLSHLWIKVTPSQR